MAAKAQNHDLHWWTHPSKKILYAWLASPGSSTDLARGFSELKPGSLSTWQKNLNAEVILSKLINSEIRINFAKKVMK